MWRFVDDLMMGWWAGGEMYVEMFVRFEWIKRKGYLSDGEEHVELL